MQVRILTALLVAGALLGACLPRAPLTVLSAGPTAEPPEVDSAMGLPGSGSPTVAPQAISTIPTYGPEAEHFPVGINPLSGLPASDAQLLKIPAVLVSISHFPPSSRPQAGLSFAPYVYEFSITRGETRFLAAFYGRFPQVEVPVTGDCAVRSGVFARTGVILGNRVWLDANANGIQDPEEEGVPGICVELQSAEGVVLQTTATDTNGMYGFSISPGQPVKVHFRTPANMDFTAAHIGFDDLDSDADPESGSTQLIDGDSGSLNWDAGVIVRDVSLPQALPGVRLPPAEVGPVRSGRLLYAHLGTLYSDSCLIYAYADPAILAKLPHCAFVPHEDAGGGDMLTIERMRAVAEDNMRHTADRPFSYASNQYSAAPPAGGLEASRLDVQFGRINQSAWIYDPLYEAYLRFVDNADVNAVGVLHADSDRLTGRQIHVENVIIAMVDTDVITRTNIDIHLEGGNTGPAKLFRNGRLFDITWSTRGGAYEKKTGLRRPIQFLNTDGTAVALRPGHTWVILVTPFSDFEAEPGGAFRIRYGPASGEAQ